MNSPHFQEWIDLISAPRRALLIDDDENDKHLIILNSQPFNIEWETAADGATAMDILKRNKRYDLIVLDLKLQSEPQGILLFRAIKIICPTCPVLVLSGYITNDVIANMTQIGFVMFAKKPASFDSTFFSELFQILNIPKRITDAEPAV